MDIMPTEMNVSYIGKKINPKIESNLCESSENGQHRIKWEQNPDCKDAENSKEFLVLDEIAQDSDKDSDSDAESEFDRDSDEVPEDEIEALLDEQLPDSYKGAPKKKECPYDQRQKIVLEEKGINHFEVLPLGWLMVTHNSGMPLYLHKPSRVCTLSKPYFLGPGSVRKHEIPISAIPCLNYKRALQEEEAKNVNSSQNKNPIKPNEKDKGEKIKNIGNESLKALKRPLESKKEDNLKRICKEAEPTPSKEQNINRKILNKGDISDTINSKINLQNNYTLPNDENIFSVIDGYPCKNIAKPVLSNNNSDLKHDDLLNDNNSAFGIVKLKTSCNNVVKQNSLINDSAKSNDNYILNDKSYGIVDMEISPMNVSMHETSANISENNLDKSQHNSSSLSDESIIYENIEIDFSCPNEIISQLPSPNSLLTNTGNTQDNPSFNDRELSYGIIEMDSSKKTTINAANKSFGMIEMENCPHNKKSTNKLANDNAKNKGTTSFNDKKTSYGIIEMGLSKKTTTNKLVNNEDKSLLNDANKGFEMENCLHKNSTNKFIDDDSKNKDNSSFKEKKMSYGIIEMETSSTVKLESDETKIEDSSSFNDKNISYGIIQIKPSLAKDTISNKQVIDKDKNHDSAPLSNDADASVTPPIKNIVNSDLLKKLVNSDSVEQDKAARAMALMLPNAKVETAQENWKSHHLRHSEVTDYCRKLFKFKSINIMRFKSWSERRKFTKTRKALQRPTLPDGTKLITFPVQTALVPNNSDPDSQGALGTFKTVQKECLMNPNGKSYVCILHEYVQRALKKQPTYEFKELENGATPYSATVSINGIRYGVGYGTSKRLAKSAAAKSSIEILIPEMREKISQDNEINGTASRACDQDLAFFDDISIQDPRVADFCAKTMEPSPHTILQTCLARNFGVGDREIKYQMNTLKHQRNEFTITVGKHTATVVCKNKRDGKQRASQAILQALHPNISSWGSLLRLYGTRSVKSFKEKKQEEQEITLLQSRAAVNQPNYAILEKLQAEMTKLREKDLAINPIGKLVVQEDLPAHSGTNLSIVDL